MSLILRILANSAAIIVAAKYIPGFVFTGSPVDLLIAGTVVGLINALIKPIIQLIALPVVFLTLGLFNIIINVGLLLLASKLLPQLSIDGFWAAFWGVVIISVMNYLISHFNKQNALK